MSSQTQPSSTIRTIIKRDGRHQAFSRDKLIRRMQAVIREEERHAIDVDRTLESILKVCRDRMEAPILDRMIAEIMAQYSFLHPAYDKVAGRIAMGRIYKATPSSFSDSVKAASTAVPKILSNKYLANALDVAQILDNYIRDNRDFDYDYMAVKAFEQSYLLRDDHVLFERPQHMYMRVAVTIHGRDTRAIHDTYELLSKTYYTHASPTMFHAGTATGQLSSCFLLPLNTATSTGTYKTLWDCAAIGRGGGGIGLSITDYPATGETRHRVKSAGIVPMIQLFDASVALTEQGENKRPGAMAIYLEPWHADIYSFLAMKRSRGAESGKARRLFYALWVPDLFIDRVKDNREWSLFDPGDVPDLSKCYGTKFELLYHAYEAQKKARRTVPARNLWQEILETQAETGGPFMLYKDAINRKSNQRHCGTITHANLCTEITQVSTSNQTAVCNLASLVLPRYVDARKGFDFDRLHEVTKIVVRNVNRVIDLSTPPTRDGQISNMMHRAMGIGIQGLADTFLTMNIPFDSPAAVKLSADIAETMYHAAIECSCELSETYGSYPAFPGSPLANGQFQFDLWKVKPSNRYMDWETLRQRVRHNGVANSLLIALMPTAGTSQITGCIEGFEPLSSNLYTRNVLSGSYQSLSPHLVADLEGIGMWSEAMRLKLVAERGSIQDIEEIPLIIRSKYKTAYEIDPCIVVDHAAARGPFVCQSQSMSLFIDKPNFSNLTTPLIYGWEKGLKTGMYYLRSKPSASPTQFTLPSKPKPASMSEQSQQDGSDGPRAPAPPETICEACSA